MANIEDPHLVQLYNRTFEWLVQNGEPTPATEVEPALGPGGLPIVQDPAKYDLALSGFEVWGLDPNAAQILGVDDEDGQFSLCAYEAAYNRRPSWDLLYIEPGVNFAVTRVTIKNRNRLLDLLIAKWCNKGYYTG